MTCDLLEHYREFYRHNDDVFVARKTTDDIPSRYIKYDIAEFRGRGWADMYQINNGLVIGRGQFSLHTLWQSDYCSQRNNLSLYILLSGKVRISDSARKREREFSRGSILVHRHSNAFPAIHYRQLPDLPFEGVSIEVPAAIADGLQTGAIKQKCVTSSDSPLDMDSLHPQHPCFLYVLQAARMILNHETDSVIGRLQVEAAALDILTRVCAGEHAQKASGYPSLSFRQRSAVSEARQILECEFREPHTITSLSRRVQLNECYLKAAFRKITGYTIAEFLRKERMAHARYLIEKQKVSVLEAALSVGYSNPSHFTTAFRAVYGVLPSSLKSIRL